MDHTSAPSGVTATTDELVRLRHRAARAPAPRGPVRTAQAGLYRSPFRGRGMDFAESRLYQPGDDARTIDWRVSARTGRVHTKVFDEERERPVLLLVDERPGMRFGTRRSFKSVLAARVAAVLAWTAHDAGDRVGALVSTAAGCIEVPPRRSESRLVHLLRVIGDSTAARAGAGGVPLAESVARLVRVRRPGTLVFVVSDFADLDEGTERQLGRLAAGADVVLVLVYDPLEAAAPRGTGLRVSDGEHVLTLATRDPGWRADWEQCFQSRRARLERLCRRHGMELVPLCTSEGVEALPSAALGRSPRARRAVGAARSVSSASSAARTGGVW